MSVTYLDFISKFPPFLEVTEAQFNQFLVDAIMDINLYNWQLLGTGWEAFRDRAIEAHVACNLSSVNPELLGSAGLAEFEVREAGYRVKYLANSGGGTGNPFCAKYQQLINQIQALTPSLTTLPANTCGIRKRTYWD